MKKNNKKGFTLVELVIVVAVMAVLVAVAIPTVGSIKGSAESAVNDSNARTIESIIKLAQADALYPADNTSGAQDQFIANALADAKLGISKATKFYHNATTGDVTTKTGTGLIEIAYTAAGAVSYNSKTGTVGGNAPAAG